MIPGLCAARGEEQHTNTVRISVIKDQSTEIKRSEHLTFPIKTYWNAVYVTSHLGCLGRPAGVHSPSLLYGTGPTAAYVQTAAASCTGEIPSYLDTDPEFQRRPFQQW